MVELAILDQLRAAQVIPVIRHSDTDIATKAIDLLLEQGIKAVEITTSVADADGLVRRLKARDESLLVGAGTVLDRVQAQAMLDAGSDFIVSPCWVDEVANLVIKADGVYLPGAMTPAEALHHHKAGAALVKIFPADAAGGPGFLRALCAVFPDIPLMPTGGIQPRDVSDYLQAGAVCVGVGGNLMPSQALEAGDLALAQAQICGALRDMPRPQ
ncbi:bifunctional 4-hydroxy-2-oxoglutarate aldolase/2-dehydro-3-deoxy-phosphogluconate aldolase [Cohaesibacter intestini]|uniref:bifunctional 4-hydroxy-2-oxoglutarate aldolase/2-dehydro-3-deoxy-phosphogluconate aldolase n=1 Tax=Cohaesibacter intestini TaxID=2211145 RepID=UPI000DE92BB6|nr:bifunctional 4-hydroxy-2-oxoglutarate aldolase/2-dehydro-3-deoxy-phosphogluconate aldolase [Cohaesibacter intestini]